MNKVLVLLGVGLGAFIGASLLVNVGYGYGVNAVKVPIHSACMSMSQIQFEGDSEVYMCFPLGLNSYVPTEEEDKTYEI